MTIKKCHKKHYNFFTKARIPLFNLLFALVWWNVFIRLFISLKFIGSINAPFDGHMPKSFAFFNDNISLASLIVSLFAIIDWCFDTFVFNRLLKRNSVRVLSLRRFISNIIAFSIIGLIMATYHYSFERNLSFLQTLGQLDSFFFNPVGTYFFVVGLLISSSLFLIQSVQRNLGWPNLLSLIVGKYRTPKEEDRIFLFVDLVSSTEVAEKLGHQRYSSFLQECYKIMSNAILLTHATVYQFVGDEAVLTWKSSQQKNFLKAVNFYYQFTADLEKRSSYFEKKFGLIPKFTASVNSGNIMVAEVGEIKNEIAYHGDVLNTAARIQKQCKKYNAKVLATESFTEILQKNKNGYLVDFIDQVKIYGKKTTC